ncbi:MAG: tRNA uridine-5-carboxymethylaminomethyl(34) synthesis GTPase MnmE, partial [Bacilli bacterium]|nr:tRNA uridine-5-carboxymethylaminomethyl(34) synthesis GTPase MnmE [Bacilli bacterium]
VEKSYEIIDKSDLIIFLLNNNEPLTKEDLELYNKIKNKTHIIVLNKTDLKQVIDLTPIKEEVLKVSLLNNDASIILDKIKELFNLEKLETSDLTYLSNARSISLLKKSLNNISNAIDNINNNDPIDIVELELKNAWSTLGEIIGETYTEELLDELFSRFCLGK